MTGTPETREAVLVVDLQVGMFDGVAEPPLAAAETLAGHARAVIAWARRSGRPVAFVRHDGSEGDPLAPGEPGWPVAPALGQATGEPTFSKSVGNAFSNPDLGEWLARQDADGVVLLGAQTEFCIAATVAGALAAGLAVTVVSDAHGTRDDSGETAAQIVARHNAAFVAAGARLATVSELSGTG